MLVGNTSVRQLATATAFAVYVAFSPFFGLHTIMLIAGGWLFRMNIPFLIAVGYGVNNPWTMIPIYMGGYFFGYWIVHGLLGFSVVDLNPWWVSWATTRIADFLHIQEPSFWAFMVGGNVLGIILALISYPIAVKLIRRWKHTHTDKYEDNQ